MTEHWENLYLDNIVEEFNGVVYTEQWMPVVGYESKYHISSFGRVKSLNYGRSKGSGERILKQGLCAGYPRVDLIEKTNHKLVHIMTATHFVPNPENKPQVNHKWGIKTDNRFHQLEWFNYSEQQIHAQKVLGFNPNISGLLAKVEDGKTPVKQINPDTNETIKTYGSQQEACKAFGLDKDAIYRVLKKRQELVAGFKWEYA